MYYGLSVHSAIKAPDLCEGTNQFTRMIEMSRYLDNVHGTCMWPAYPIVSNAGGAGDQLINVEHSRPAVIPAYDFIDAVAPAKVKSLKLNGGKLTWKRAATKDPMQEQIYFVVYHFAKGEKVDVDAGNHIVTTTRSTEFTLPAKAEGTYVVTAMDRCHNESEAVSVTIK